MEEDFAPLALEAVLLFHSGSPWDDEKRHRWVNICAAVRAPQSRNDYGQDVGWDATTKTLCDIVRAAIAQIAIARADNVPAKPAKKLSGDVLVSAAYGVACFTEAGEQIPELQKGLLELWAEHAERLGYDPAGVVFATPHGRWTIFRTTDGGWNWELAGPKAKSR